MTAVAHCLPAAAESAAESVGHPLVLPLRYGHLRECALTSARVLPAAAEAAFPGTRFTVVGQSGLRFLLDPTCSTWAAAAANNESPAGDVRSVEEAAVAASSTLSEPMSWVEEVGWLDGPARGDVDRILWGTVALAGVTEAGLGPAGRYPAHWLGRRYSPHAFAFYALVHHPHGRQLLGELSAPVLPAPGACAAGPVTFASAHAWLADVDLRWLRTPHPVHGLLSIYLRMLPAFSNEIVDPADVHAGIDSGLLTVATAIDRSPDLP